MTVVADNGDDAAFDALMSSLVPNSDDDDAGAAPQDDDAAAVAALTASLQPNPDDGGEDDDDGDQDNADGDQAGQPAGDQPPKAPAAALAALADDVRVVLEIDGSQREFTGADLKHLAAQGDEIGRRLEEADAVGARTATILQDAFASIVEDLQPYAEVDWVLEGRRMDPEEFEWHRENFNRLSARRDAVLDKVRQFDQTMTARRTEAFNTASAAADRVLSDPKTGIAGWNTELRGQLMDFAESAGLDRAEAETIVNPNVLKILNDARLYRQAKKATASKVNMTPSNVRAGAGSEPIAAETSKRQKALEARVKSGAVSDDDAVAVLMGRWGSRG